MTALVEVENLVFDYPGSRALHTLSFKLQVGSVTALVGPNGAGKTTLLRCLAALDTPVEGRILIGGIDALEDPRGAHLRLGYLPDHFGLYEDLSVRRCLEYSAHSRGLPGAAIPARIDEVSLALDIGDKLTSRAGDLSRGQRQRVALAQAIMHRPPLLLLDEPASGLDPEARATLALLIRRLQSQGMTLLVSSHILAELETYCDGMLILRDGRLVEQTFSQAQPSASAPAQTLILRLADPSVRESALSLLQAQPGVSEARSVETDRIRLRLAGGGTEQAALLGSLIAAGFAITDFHAETLRMQDAYIDSLHTKTARS